MIEENGKYYLYRHIRLDKYMPFYIGIGTQYDKYKYYSRAKVKHTNEYWKNIVNETKYKIEILLESNDYDFIKEKEKYFIKLYGRKINNTGILANISEGGDGFGGIKQTKETIEKRVSKIRGKKRSLETKQKLSEIHKGKTFSQKTIDSFKMKINQYDLEGNFIKEWKSLSEAAKNLNLSTTEISKVCKGLRNHTHKFIFRYLNDDKFTLKCSKKGEWGNKKIIRIDLQGNEKIYNSITEASKDNFEKSSLHRVLKNGKLYKKYYWKYK